MKTYIIPIFILLFSVSLFAQQNRDRVKALKVSFITEKLDLTPKEAQAFWPVYNTFEENSTKIRQQNIRSIRREIKQNLNTLTDAKASELLERLIQAENNLHKEHMELMTKLKDIISPQKIIMLRAAEDDFKRKLFDQYKRKRNELKNE